MIAGKNLKRAVALMLCVCLAVCGFIVYAAGAFDTSKTVEYQSRMFGDAIVSLEIRADSGDWQSLLDGAQTKEWISADLIINGERYTNVGVRAKGNSSLSQVAASDGDRYSLQFKMNKYVKGQTYYGLDSFCINNMTGDASYMKDYISYQIMSYIGVDAPLTNYADVTVNGESYGFCLVLERYDKAFLDRVYDTSAGELYSVKISMGNRGNFEDRWQDIENDLPVRRQAEDDAGENAAPDNLAQGGFPDRVQGGDGAGGVVAMGGMGGNGGGSLVYTDDDPASYSAIFDNAVFNASDKDKKRVITAIKNLNEGTELEKYFDVDEILRYFAAHTVVVNLDSYVSNMQQNYYIYERDGKISILPWDYNLALGGYQSGDASSVVNFPIDTPVSGVSMEERPLLNVLLEVEEYRERYHGYLSQIVEGYFESGLFESTVNALDTKINGYVKNDATAFFTYEQYEAAVPELIKLGKLRAESIKGQLDGTIPSTSGGQSADKGALTDASAVNLSALGGMGGMGQGGRGDWGNQAQGAAPTVPDGQNQDAMPAAPEEQAGDNFLAGGPGGGNMGGVFDRQLMQQAMQLLSDAGGELTDEVKSALLELGVSEQQLEMFAGMQNGGGFGGRAPGGFGGMGQSAEPSGGVNAPAGLSVLILVVLAVILAGAIVFVARPKRNVV